VIRLIQQPGYQFPQPKYSFGQTVIDENFDIGFVSGMQYTCGEWEYQIFFTELEVLGVNWVKESNLSLEVVEA
jgi:hypothetical protein